MSNQAASTTPILWSCNWNWCPETFRDSRDLGKHLQETHYNKILQVKKRDWDAYLRSTEGRSGATDSLLAAIPDPGQSTQSLSQDHMEVDETPRRSISGSLPPRRSASGSVRHRSSLPMTPPPVPPFPRDNRRTSAEIRAEPQHPRASFNAFPSPGEKRRTSSPSSSQLSASDVKRRRTSFASYRAQSSPMSTPSVASVPPSPSLTNMVADAINRTAQLNATSPSARLSQSRKPDSGVVTVPPLPRRMGPGLSPTTDRPNSSRPVPTSPLYPQSQSRASPTKALSSNSPGAASVGSAQAVEEALTQNVFSSASSRVPNNSSRQSSGSSSSISSPRKPAQRQPSLHSNAGGSHGTRSSPQPQPPPPPEIQTKVEPVPDVKPVIAEATELAYPHSSTSSSPADVPALLAPPRTPPLPRRTRSRTPAQPPAPTTRTLRSRSNSKVSALAPPPAASQSKSLPLPRTRSRAGSRTNADSQASAAAPAKGQRATSKPPSTTGKRAGSVGPTAAVAGGRKGTRANPGGLAAVDEQPGEASQPAASQPPQSPQTQPQTQTQRPPTFRSGTLPLPRRQQLQSQVQSQAAALAAGRFGEDEGLDVKVKRELLDPEVLLTQSQNPSQGQSQSQSQSQDGGAWDGFQLNPLELLTQKPFPSQSQGWGPSQ